MKELLVFLIALVIISSCALAQDVEIKNISEVNISEGIVLLDFMATWCTYCRQEMDELQIVHEQYGDEIRIISIDIDPRESTEVISGYKEEINAGWEFAVDDSGLSTEYQAFNLPTLILLKDGEQIERYVGTRSASADILIEDIEKVL
jgi:thiol-disulfide isomerase/thioredoxin